MNRFRLLLAFVVNLSCNLLQGEIIETNYFDTIKEHVDENTLIVLDIDNTLIEPVQMLGSDQWFYHQFKDYVANGMSAEDALEKALPEWEAIQNMSEMKLVEEGTAKTVAELQAKGYTVIGLTTRGLGMSTLAVKQLAKVGIDLNKTAPTDKELLFANPHDMYPDRPHSVIFRQGILFTSGSSKKTAFAQLVDALGLTPKKVVFINDKESHLKPVGAACQEKNIPFVGLRYAATDDAVKNYDPEVASVQWQEFGRLLSDDEAKSRLTTKAL